MEDPIVLADRNGVIQFWNDAASSAFGYARGEAVGQTLDLIVPPEHRGDHWVGFKRAVASGFAAAEGEPGPFPVRHADGGIIPRQGRLNLIRSPQGAVVAALVAFAQDPDAHDPDADDSVATTGSGPSEA